MRTQQLEQFILDEKVIEKRRIDVVLLNEMLDKPSPTAQDG